MPERHPLPTDRRRKGYRKIKFCFQEKQCIIFYSKEKNQNLFHQYNVMYYSTYNIMYFFIIPNLMKDLFFINMWCERKKCYNVKRSKRKNVKSSAKMQCQKICKKNAIAL